MSNNDGKNKSKSKSRSGVSWKNSSHSYPQNSGINRKSRGEFGVGSVEEGRETLLTWKRYFRTEGALGWSLDRFVP